MCRYTHATVILLVCFLKPVFSDLDDVFLPKDIDLDSEEMDETEREVEYFKRCELFSRACVSHGYGYRERRSCYSMPLFQNRRHGFGVTAQLQGLMFVLLHRMCVL